MINNYDVRIPNLWISQQIKIWETVISECPPDDYVCPVKKLDEYNIDAWDINLVTPAVEGMGKKALNIQKKSEG